MLRGANFKSRVRLPPAALLLPVQGPEWGLEWPLHRPPGPPDHVPVALAGVGEGLTGEAHGEQLGHWGGGSLGPWGWEHTQFCLFRCAPLTRKSPSVPVTATEAWPWVLGLAFPGSDVGGWGWPKPWDPVCVWLRGAGGQAA